MKKLLLLALLATALKAEPVAVRPSGWSLGTEFPASPETSQKQTKTDVGEVSESLFGCQLGGEIFLLGRVQYPAAIPESQRESAYTAGKQGMLRARPGTVVFEERVTMGGQAGRRYLVETQDGSRLIDHRFLIVGAEVYQFIYERPKAGSDSAAGRRFFSEISGRSR